MTHAQRIERGGLLCEKLRAEVAAMHAPDHTPSTWGIITGLDADFLIALTAWEATGAERDRLRVRDAYLAITSAWQAMTSAPTDLALQHDSDDL